MTITRDDVKTFLCRLTVKEMVVLYDEVLQEDWRPRQVPMGWTITFKSYGDKVRAIKVMRRILDCTMVEAQSVVNDFPHEITRESFCRSDIEFYRALCLDNGIAFEATENLIDDPWDPPPSIQHIAVVGIA